MELKLKEQAQAYMRKPKEQSILVWIILGILAFLLILFFFLRK